MSKIGYAPIEIALDRTKFVAKESDSVVWSVTLGHLRNIYQMLTDDSTAHTNFKVTSQFCANANTLLSFYGLSKDSNDFYPL